MPNRSNGLEFVAYYQEPQGDRFNLFFDTNTCNWSINAIEGFAVRTMIEGIRDAIVELQSMKKRTKRQNDVLKRSLEEIGKLRYSDDKDGVMLAYLGINSSFLFESISNLIKPKPVADFIFAGKLEQCVMYKNNIEPMEKQNFAKHLLFLTSHAYDAIGELKRREDRDEYTADRESTRRFGRGVNTYETSLKALLGYVPSYVVKLYHNNSVYFDETARSRPGKNICMYKEMQPTIELIANTRKLIREGMNAATRCSNYLMTQEARTEIPMAAMRNIAEQTRPYVDMDYIPPQIRNVMQLLLK